MEKTKLLWKSISESIVEFLNRDVITDSILEDQLQTMMAKVDSALLRDHDLSSFVKPVADVLSSKQYFMNMYRDKPVSEDELTAIKDLGISLTKLYVLADKDERDRYREKIKQEPIIEEESRLPNPDEGTIKEKYNF